MTERGLFIAIEGGDGTGKATQAEILRKYFSEELKKDVFKISFPRYTEKSSYYASQYLNGAYGSADQISGDLAGLAYAVDRFAAKDEMTTFLDRPSSIIVADRYVASNLAHQGTKFTDTKERKEYYERAMYLEYDIFGIPRPDINIVLLMSTEMMQSNVDKKDTRSYTDKKRDIHEADASHLDRAKANYEELCQLYPDKFIAIQCIDEKNQMKSIDEIQQQIRTSIKTHIK
ncbi:hypothetical protein CVV43_01960 [Candidatus Saccharibacteria bacterium HGW-Saccharibacteria-1]|jgi:dTMP kinase|nr:MAG: hypothetical protein CVV43_01960 [Candidatus Saccharibacteria bacterium HGW-Saccharibacteria-1]